MKNRKAKMVIEAAKVVDDWVRDEFIPSFDSKRKTACTSLEAAAVMNMNDCIQYHLKEAAHQVAECGEDEEVLTSCFDVLPIEDFYRFFVEKNHTLCDIYDNWVDVEVPSGALFGLSGAEYQVDAILKEIKFILEHEDKN